MVLGQGTDCLLFKKYINLFCVHIEVRIYLVTLSSLLPCGPCSEDQTRGGKLGDRCVNSDLHTESPHQPDSVLLLLVCMGVCQHACLWTTCMPDA